MGVRASCARRLEVRALEWRRFGLGIADSFRSSVNNPSLKKGLGKNADQGSGIDVALRTLNFYPAAKI
jgi:hypothetical protein